MYDFKLVSKIKTRIESIIGALQQRDFKLAFKIIKWLLLRKTIFQVMKYDPIFSMVKNKNIKLDDVTFPLGESYMLTSRDNYLEYLFNIYEPWVGNIIDKNIKEGMVFIDIGANLGYFSALAAGKGARVYAFEPVDMAFEQLKKIKLLNSHLDITVENLALGHKNGRTLMRALETQKLPGSYLPLPLKFEHRRFNNGIQEILVNMVTLDSYVAEKAIGRIDLIKIDVEGYEPFVLLGARKSIRRYKPIIVCEITNTGYLGKTAEILKKICVECGYKMKFADGRLGEPNLNKSWRTTDIVLYR